MRQAKMKQVQAVPTAAIRQVENCLLLLHRCYDEDLAAPVWLHQRGMNVSLTNSNEQNIKEINTLLCPFSSLPTQILSLFSFQLHSLCQTQLKRICAFPSSQPTSIADHSCIVPFLKPKGCWGDQQVGLFSLSITYFQIFCIFPGAGLHSRRAEAVWELDCLRGNCYTYRRHHSCTYLGKGMKPPDFIHFGG